MRGQDGDLMTTATKPGYAEVVKPCCDEHGWVLDSRGRPVEPAVKCSIHTGRRGATKPVNPAPADAPDTRDGNKNKFAWFYEMLADETVSLAAKVVGTGCVMKMAGRKGHFKTTRKAVANLCGISQSTVRRGLADLIAKRFLEADLVDGAASTYYLILPAKRLQERLDKERELQVESARAEQETGRWLWAEKLHKENQFRDAVREASIARGADAVLAARIAKNLAARVVKEGDELEVDLGLEIIASWKDESFVPAAPAVENPPSGDPESDHERADPGTPESRPRYATEPGSVRQRADPGTPESRPRLTPDANTSGDDQTHKSFKDSERPIKVFQDSESEPALRNALNARPPRSSPNEPDRNAGPCELCGGDGIFRDPHGYRVVLIDDEGFEDPVDCQHSIAANLAEIQRREKAEDRSLCRTGWPEIDAHYPIFDDDGSDVF